MRQPELTWVTILPRAFPPNSYSSHWTRHDLTTTLNPDSQPYHFFLWLQESCKVSPLSEVTAGHLLHLHYPQSAVFLLFKLSMSLCGRDSDHEILFYSRPATSFAWFSSPFKSLRYILWRRYKWKIIVFLVIVLVVALVVLFFYAAPVSCLVSELCLTQ